MSCAVRPKPKASPEPPPEAAPRHRWGHSRNVFNEHTGNDQTQRICVLCGLVKITVHPPRGYPWREWRDPRGGGQLQFSGTPACGGEKKMES